VVEDLVVSHLHHKFQVVLVVIHLLLELQQQLVEVDRHLTLVLQEEEEILVVQVVEAVVQTQLQLLLQQEQETLHQQVHHKDNLEE
tara:strand:+ start:228 stop:485 length:258 start_codon:yes stop_codon:yes gene_type:complete